MKLFQEIHYWERLMFEIPHYAAEVYTKREDLRGTREHVLLVVRDYNRYHIYHNLMDSLHVTLVKLVFLNICIIFRQVVHVNDVI